MTKCARARARVCVCSVGENNIGTPKIRKIIVISNFHFFRYYDSNIWLLSFASIVKLPLLFFANITNWFKAITIWGAINKRTILLLQYRKNGQFDGESKIVLQFGCTNNIFGDYIMVEMIVKVLGDMHQIRS